MDGSRGSAAVGAMDNLAQPLHLQKLYKSLNLNPLLDYVESVINQPISDSDLDSDDMDISSSRLDWNNDSSIYNLTGVQKKRRWVVEAIGHSSDSDSDSASVFLDDGNSAYSKYSQLSFNKTNYSSRLRIDPNLLGGRHMKEDVSEDEEDDCEDALDDVDVTQDEAMDVEDADVDVEHFAGDKKELCDKDCHGPKLLNIVNQGGSNKGILSNLPKHDDKSNIKLLHGKDKFKWKEKFGILKKEFSGENCGIRSDEMLSTAAVKTELEVSSDTDTKPFKDESDSDNDDDDATEDSDDDQTDDSEDGDSDESQNQLKPPISADIKDGGSISGTRQRQLNRINAMMREHLLRKGHAASYRLEGWSKEADTGSGAAGEVTHRGRSFLYYGAGLLSNVDRYSDHQRYMAVTRRGRAPVRAGRQHNGGVLPPTGDRRKGGSYGQEVAVKEEDLEDLPAGDQVGQDSLLGEEGDDGLGDVTKIRTRPLGKKEKKGKKLDAQALAVRRHKLWLGMARKEVVRSQRSRAAAHKEQLHNCKRVATAATKTYRQKALQSQKVVKDKLWLLKRLSRSMQVEWKKFERLVKEQNKRAEREAEEQRKMDKEIMEAKRQQRKVNFLITLPELYSHFMKNKTSGGDETSEILRQLEDSAPRDAASTADDYDSESLKAQAVQTAQEAVRSQQSVLNKFDASRIKAGASTGGEKTQPGEREYEQPAVFMGQLKSYQLKGMNWIANLYYFGINGILADEMGLGKTVQAVAFLAHICEEYDTWGPFLIVTPASTLHNWTAEINRFVPEFKVVPYWGTPEERKSLRKFFDVKNNGDRTESSFHVVVTSYHIVIQDFKFLNRLKWNYMVLDEAQAIKSINSQRWKLLLGFSCRNRLLLSGTPIQNTMAELWALLHFIMPALFDSHQWFNEWFSKDIEGHAEHRTHVDEKHLNRLHTILKPFMLRRIKTEVENELTDKIEIMVYCPLTLRQKFLYSGLKNKISIEELLHSSSGTLAAQATVATSLMNLVMQFRKVCNHPELLEQRVVQSPMFMLPEVLLVPRSVYHFPARLPVHLLHMLSPHNCYNIHNQLGTEGRDRWISSWWFASLCGLSVQETSCVLRGDLLAIWIILQTQLKHTHHLSRHRRTWATETAGTVSSPADGSKRLETLEIGDEKDRRTACIENLLFPHRDYSNGVLRKLVFCDYTCNFYTFTHHTYHSMPETQMHRTMRLNKAKKPKIEEITPPPSSEELSSISLSTPDLNLSSISDSIYISSKTSLTSSQDTLNSSQNMEEESLPPPGSLPYLFRPPIRRACETTYLPNFLGNTCSKVMCGSRVLYSYDHHTRQWQSHRPSTLTFATLQHGVRYIQAKQHAYDTGITPKFSLQDQQSGGLESLTPTARFNKVIIPDKHSMMMDAGKLFVLDSLLKRMKAAGNRVLIYSQMTKMINLLEDYMRHRHHKYMRLDGSSKISDRRDMVEDFQTKSDIFVFLLSTRAGGVGINLTAADTVIFYDSDWNPTVDQQAMDRAHRVGQTKQVTVYRLICKGTIEERILQRAKEKSEIQRMVISGGNFKPETLKPKEVVSLLLDDDIEQQFRARQDERRALDEQRVEYNREKMRKRYAEKKLEREQQEGKRRRVEEDLPIDVCGSPARSLTPSSESEEVLSSVGGAEEGTNDTFISVDDSTLSDNTPIQNTTATTRTTATAIVSPSVSVPAPTTVRGHRKRGRPRMSTMRGRGAAARVPPPPSPSAADTGNVGGVVVKRGRGRPRLLPLGPGHQGQRPVQVLPAALGALQQRNAEDAAPHS